MRVMFLVVLLEMLTPFTISPALRAEKVISNYPSDFASHVFVGADDSMPVSGEFRFSIHPTIDASGHVVVPANIRASFAESQHMLPHWFLSALRRPMDKEHTCLVTLNNESLSSYVIYWTRTNWHLDADTSPLGIELHRLGVHGEDAAGVLYGASCRYLITGRIDDGLAFISQYRLEKSSVH